MLHCLLRGCMHASKIISLWTVQIEGSPRIVGHFHDDLSQGIEPASLDHVVDLLPRLSVRAILQAAIRPQPQGTASGNADMQLKNEGLKAGRVERSKSTQEGTFGIGGEDLDHVPRGDERPEVESQLLEARVVTQQCRFY